MELNNLTPDENLKQPIYFNKNEEPIKTYDTVEAPGISFGDSIVHSDIASDDEYDFFNDSKEKMVCFLFVCGGLLILIAALFFLTFFNISFS